MSNLHHPPAEIVGTKAERRNLTVLFCDIVGSSALSAHLDPEDLREILRAFQASCGDAIRRYDGHIARYMGDGVLAYFGFPMAHEDDAERAVNTALQMIEAVCALTFPRARPLQVRIGIATGLVVVGDLIGEGPSREFALIGEAPNLAACLQQYAKPNQILVSMQTRRLLGNLFEFADLGEYPFKGHDEPVRVWSVLRANAIPSRFEARQSSRLTPFFGRDRELAVLHEQYKKALRGQGQIIAISGEPGIGKSRLIATLRNQLASETYRTLLFQCSSYHTSSPWHPVIRHLEDAMGVSHDTPPSLKLKKLETLVSEHLEEKRESIVPLLAALLSIPTGDRYPALELTPQQQKKRTFTAVLDLVRAQCWKQPIILVCEDLHWMDPTSWELLQQLHQHVRDWPVLVILSFRPEIRLPWTDESQITTLVLNRLEPTHVASIIESLTDGSALPLQVVEQIASKTDGVPLFVEEVTKAVLEARAASEDFAASGSPWVPTVPDTLHDSLMARLDQLAPMKAIAQIAAAIGREFDLDLLVAIAPLTMSEVRAAIDRLLESGLLFRRTHAAVEGYTFKHALVQDVAYTSLLRDERRELHVRIAEALATRFVETAEGAPELIAHHYTQARQIKPAIDYWLRAGRQASTRSAFVEAITHFQAALKLLTELPESSERDELELQLQQSLASAFIAAKGFGAGETTQAFNRALQLCEKFEGSPQVYAALNGMVGVHLMRAEFERSRSLAQDLLTRALRQNDSTALMMGHRVLGMSLFVIGELDNAKHRLQKALELYDAPRHAPLALIFSHDFKATAQAYLGLTSILLGDIEVGLAHNRDALVYAEQLRHPHSVCYVLPFLAGAYLIAGMPQTAYPSAERTIALSSEYGFPQWVAGGLMLRGWARIELGEIESGLSDIRKCIGALEATGTLIWMQFAQFLLATALAKKGQPSAALELVDRIIAEIGATSGRWYAAEVLRFKGDLLLSAGAAAGDVEACYESAIAVASHQGARLWQLRATNALGTLWRAHGRTAELHARLAPLCASFNDKIANLDLQQGKALLSKITQHDPA